MKAIIIFCLIFFITMQWCVCAQQVEIVYKTYCGGCHGADLQGNSATALLKSEWKYGAEKQQIFHTIKTGIPNTDMNGWSGILKDEQIAALVDYIKGSQGKPSKIKSELPSHITTKDYNLKIEKLVSFRDKHAMGN